MLWLGEGDDQLRGSGRRAIARVPLEGRVTTNFVPLLVPSYGAIVYYGWGRVTTDFGGVDVVPLQGAIVVRYGWGRSLREWTWCHCWVPL